MGHAWGTNIKGVVPRGYDQHHIVMTRRTHAKAPARRMAKAGPDVASRKLGASIKNPGHSIIP